MASSYSVHLTVLGNGERLPVLINNATGLPDVNAMLYALFCLRQRLRSWRSMDAALRAVGIFLAHVRDAGIDLKARIQTGRYLDLIELDGLSARLQAATRLPAAPMTGRPAEGQEGQRPKRSAGTLAILVNAIARFLTWLVEFTARSCWPTLAERLDGEALSATFLKRVRSSVPRGSGGGCKRLSL